MSTYEVLKRVITRGGYDKAKIQGFMNLFVVYEQITTEQYAELMGAMM